MPERRTQRRGAIVTVMLESLAINPAPRERDIAMDCELVRESGLVDVPAYGSAAGLPADVDPIRHYLVHGWRAGFEPRANVRINWLHPFFCSVGLDDPPILTILTLRAVGAPVFFDRAHAEEVAKTVRASGLFDPNYYAAPCEGLDAALHYLLIGECMGFAPSSLFDPVYYRSQYPDTIGTGYGVLMHYITKGRDEGRRPKSATSALVADNSGIDPQRETILLVTHEATRTGAPILAYNIAKRLRAKYNVVSLLLSGGAIAGVFADVSNAVVGPFERQDRNPAEAERIVQRLLETYRFSYAIANSIESRFVLRPLACAFVPVIALVHEFASHLPDSEDMGRSLGWATEIVFSAERVAASMREADPESARYPVHILPQGLPELPAAKHINDIAPERIALAHAMRPQGTSGDFVVLGCGTVSPRKGVDLFIACAAAVASRKPKRPIRFVWIGERLPADFDRGYYPQLLKQIRKSGAAGNVTLLDHVADLAPAYEAADAFFLSSRLDPLPNVAIESALRGLPIVCFDGCSGISDILATDSAASAGVVPHLDTNAAAEAIIRLASESALSTGVGAAVQRLAQAHFDMERYIARLDDIGHDAMEIARQRREDFATIDNDETFDPATYLDPSHDVLDRDGAIRKFILQMAKRGTERQSAPDFYSRRPGPGFHPYVYAHSNKDRYDTSRINPLAHFIRAGKPAGPWRHEVIRPDCARTGALERSGLRVALHVHFHYPELCAEFLEMAACNEAPCDLFLTTSSQAKADTLLQATAGYRKGSVRIAVIPNRGRDVGAFLTGLGWETIGQYDLVGHLHSKRSLFLPDQGIGERWREFIWQNLLGGYYPMMDIVLDRMAGDPELGLVFPDEPHLSDWDQNLAIAEQLAHQMALPGPLPPFFNFPVGTMFWARPAALAPAFGLGLTWENYPVEPAPIDGTILHALERLLPFVAEHTGHRYATTHVPGMTW